MTPQETDPDLPMRVQESLAEVWIGGGLLQAGGTGYSSTCMGPFEGGHQITADGDCSHEIKRWLLLGGKAMTNLDSILKSRDIIKSRDITLPTKVHLVKAIVFPVVMYGCESWTVKKAECQRIDAFELWC